MSTLDNNACKAIWERWHRKCVSYAHATALCRDTRNTSAEHTCWHMDCPVMERIRWAIEGKTP